MQKEPQEITSTTRPPGYDFEVASKRHRQQEEVGEGRFGYWNSEGPKPNRSKRLYLRQSDGSWERVSANYFEDGVFWAYKTRRESDKEAIEKAVEIITEGEYYRERIDTPAARGEEVTRYVVPTLRAQYVTTREENAREEAAEEGIEWSEVRVDEGIHILHGKTGQYGLDKWTYWSDGSMSSGMDRDEIGDMSATGNGQFSEAAEELLTWYWKAGGDQEHFAGGKERLTQVEDMEATILDSLKRRYGFVQYVNHDHTIKKIVAQTDEGLDIFYVVWTVYAGMAPDGFVEMKYEFFDRKRDAKRAFQQGYPARRARRSRYGRKRRQFRQRHTARYKYIDKDGTVIDRDNRDFLLPPDDVSEVRINRPFVRAYYSAEKLLLYGMGHYVVTGENFGLGITYREDGNICVTLGIKTDRGTRLNREERGWKRLLARFVELDAEIQIRELKDSEDALWREVVVPEGDAHEVGEALAEKPSPKGWGWTKELLDECVDRNQ